MSRTLVEKVFRAKTLHWMLAREKASRTDQVTISVLYIADPEDRTSVSSIDLVPVSHAPLKAFIPINLYGY